MVIDSVIMRISATPMTTIVKHESDLIRDNCGYKWRLTKYTVREFMEINER